MDKFLKKYNIYGGIMAVLALALYTLKFIVFEGLMATIFAIAFVKYLLEVINAYQKKISPLPTHIILALASGFMCAVNIGRLIR